MRPVLHTIPISHYGERARWALDHARIDYDERHHLQLFSWLPARVHSGGKYLPVLVTDGGTVADSAAILRWASVRAAASLYPTDDALDGELAGAYGVETRRVVYHWFVRSTDACFAYNAGRAPEVQVAAFRLARVAVLAFARRYLRVHDDEVERGRAVVLRTMDRIAERLRDGRRYLTGDRFTAVDLTFAAMTAPSLLPARYGVALPGLELIPADAAAFVRSCREHPAGAFALRLYDERPASCGHYAIASRV